MTAAAATTSRRTSRRSSAGMACALGAVLSLLLFGAEVGKTPTYDVGKATERRVGEVSTMTFTVKNNTGKPRCPVVHVAARDTESRTLDETVAAPPAGVTSVPAHGSVVFTGAVRITAHDYREKLRQIRPFVFKTTRCVAP
jgi:uncharacterized protein (DUF58 family)